MASVHTSTSVITIERFIMEQERLHPEATGELSNLLYDLCLAAKIISRHVRRAGLSDILGAAGAVNVSGDLQQKLDLFANETVRNSVQHTGRVCVTASEEDPEPVPVPPGKAAGKYVVLYDPLDGSMNIDVNVSIGTIFSIHKRVTKKNGTAGLVDCLQVGRKQIAAGYILYGSSTMLVYTTGQGVHGFTLDPTIGEFLLSHPNIRTPPVGRYYSVNESNWNRWTPPVQRVVAAFKNGRARSNRKTRATSGPWWPISIAISSPAASSSIRPRRTIPRASCDCCTKQRRSRLSWSRRGAGRPTAAGPFSTSGRRACIRRRRS